MFTFQEINVRFILLSKRALKSQVSSDFIGITAIKASAVINLLIISSVRMEMESRLAQRDAAGRLDVTRPFTWHEDALTFRGL